MPINQQKGRLFIVCVSLITQTGPCGPVSPPPPPAHPCRLKAINYHVVSVVTDLQRALHLKVCDAFPQVPRPPDVAPPVPAAAAAAGGGGGAAAGQEEWAAEFREEIDQEVSARVGQQMPPPAKAAAAAAAGGRQGGRGGNQGLNNLDVLQRAADKAKRDKASAQRFMQRQQGHAGRGAAAAGDGDGGKRYLSKEQDADARAVQRGGPRR
jgi:hypothetical protein